MADEEIAEVETSSGEKKGLPSIVILIIVAVVSLGVGFFGSKALGGKGGDQTDQTQQVEKTPDQNAQNKGGAAEDQGQKERTSDGQAGSSEEGAGGIEPVEKIEPGVLVMDPFTVNLNDPFGRRYAQINIKLKVVSREMGTKITGNELMMSEIRDEIFMVISSKSYNELKNTSGKITLKEEIRMRVNEIIKTQYDEEPVQKIFFEKFLIQ